MKIRRDLLTAAVLLPMLLTVGCAGGDGSTSRTKSYQNDGYLGMSNTNPSLPLTPTYHTYEVDTRMMRDAVMPIAGVRNVRIVMNGANASVKVITAKGLSEQETERIRSEAAQALQHAVPRYDFKVTTRSE